MKKLQNGQTYTDLFHQFGFFHHIFGDCGINLTLTKNFSYLIGTESFWEKSAYDLETKSLGRAFNAMLEGCVDKRLFISRLLIHPSSIA